MPKCVVCQSILPPDFLVETEDGLAQKCIFCVRGKDTIEYFSESEQKAMKTTKTETAKEYLEYLKEISDLPNVKDILDAIKERGETHILT
jgi:hypothetical protein